MYNIEIKIVPFIIHFSVSNTITVEMFKSRNDEVVSGEFVLLKTRIHFTNHLMKIRVIYIKNVIQEALSTVEMLVDVWLIIRRRLKIKYIQSEILRILSKRKERALQTSSQVNMIVFVLY